MSEPSKIQALPLSTVRERLLNERHDGFVVAHRASNPTVPSPKRAAPPGPPAAAPVPPKVKSGRQEPPRERICAYSKCRKPFISTRVDQVYHSADCRKRAWFERNFAPIAKPHGGA